MEGDPRQCDLAVRWPVSPVAAGWRRPVVRPEVSVPAVAMIRAALTLAAVPATVALGPGTMSAPKFDATANGKPARAFPGPGFLFPTSFHPSQFAGPCLPKCPLVRAARRLVRQGEAHRPRRRQEASHRLHTDGRLRLGGRRVAPYR